MPLTVLEDDLFAESQETKDYPIKPSQYRNPECPLLLEKPEWKTVQIFKHTLEAIMFWEQNVTALNTSQALVWFRGKHVPGDLPMPTSTRCPHERGACSPQTLSVSQEQGFFLIYTLWNTSRAFKCSQSRAAATAVATNPLRGSGNVYLLYEAATSIRKLLSSPAVFLRSIQCFLIYTWAVALGLSPHRGIRACWLRNINLPKDLCSLLEIFGIKHVTSLLWSWQL